LRAPDCIVPRDSAAAGGRLTLLDLVTVCFKRQFRLSVFDGGFGDGTIPFLSLLVASSTLRFHVLFESPQRNMRCRAERFACLTAIRIV